MNFDFIKRAFTYIVCLNIVFSLVLPVYANENETELAADTGEEQVPQYTANVVNNNTYKIANDITFTAQELYDTNGNKQKAFFVEFGADEFSDIIFLKGDNLNQRNLIDTLVNNLELSEGHIVAAMNADFFNMSNGVPESAFIEEGVLLTSDRDNFVLAVNSDGEYFFDKPQVKISVSFEDKNYNILHFNKEFTEYGLYLYNSEYGNKTNINVPATELVLFPYSDILDAYDVSELYFNSNAPYDSVEETYDEQSEEYIAVISEEYVEEISKFIAENNIVEINGKYYKGSSSDIKIGTELNAVVLEKRENTEIFSNEIKQNTLVLSAKTDTQAFKLEKAFVGMDLTILVEGNEKFYDVKSAIGTGAIIVNEGKVIEHNELSHYSSAQPRTAIGITSDNRIIMYSVDGRNAQNSKGLTLKQLSYEMIRLGCVIAANLDGGGSTTVKTISTDSGKFSTVNTPSDTSERKISNAIAFYNRLEATGIPAYSYLSSDSIYVLPNSSATLLNPVYFDTAFYPVKLYEVLNYENNSEISDEPEEKSAEDADNVIIDTENEDLQTDNAPNVDSSFTYYVDGEKGSVADFVYTPEGYVGKVQIISQSKDDHQNVAFEFISTDTLDKVNVVTDGTSIYVGDSVDFNAEGYIHNAKVFSEDYEYEWNVDPSFGIISADGIFTAENSGENIEISAKFGDAVGIFNAFVKELPFSDIDSHWGKKEICSVYEGGISIGELTELGRLYFPQRNFTRAEFCVMLARLLGLTVAVDTIVEDTSTGDTASADTGDIEAIVEISEDFIENTETFDDESGINIIENEEDDFTELSTFYCDFENIPDWARQSVNELFKYGLLDDYFHLSESGEYLFDSQVPVLRSEIISLIGRILPSADDEFNFELMDVSEEDANYNSIKNVLFHGIFKGYPDKTLKLDQNITRAEIAVVFNRLNDFEIGEYIFNQSNE